MKLIEVFRSRLVEGLDKFGGKRGFKKIDDNVWIGDVEGMLVRIVLDCTGTMCTVRMDVPNTGCYREWMAEIEVYYSYTYGKVDTKYKVEMCAHIAYVDKWTELIKLLGEVDMLVGGALAKAYKEVAV